MTTNQSEVARPAAADPQPGFGWAAGKGRSIQDPWVALSEPEVAVLEAFAAAFGEDKTTLMTRAIEAGLESLELDGFTSEDKDWFINHTKRYEPYDPDAAMTARIKELIAGTKVTLRACLSMACHRGMSLVFTPDQIQDAFIEARLRAKADGSTVAQPSQTS